MKKANRILQRVFVRMIVASLLVGALLAPSAMGHHEPDHSKGGKKPDKPGKDTEESDPPTSFLFAGPYDVTTWTNRCSAEPRCQPTGFTPEGHAQIRVETGDVTPPPAFASEAFRTGRLQFVHTMLVPSEAASMNVTMKLNISSALAEAVGTVNQGSAYVKLDMAAEHLDCVDMWCHGDIDLLLAEDGTGFCCIPHERAPTSRARDVLEIPVSVTNFYGAVMPAGRVQVTMEIYALTQVGMVDHFLRPLGSHSTAALDATIDEIRIDIEPAT